MATPTPRVRMPSQAKAGEVIEVKTLISHEMENGQRKDAAGKTIPRKIIKAFTLKFNGKEVFRSDWHPSISANPYLSFFVKVPETGTFEMAWHDDDGSVYKSERKVTVVG
ncbi:MAG TPA: thiosulfate oxidation carrier complex protein SoxZ [Hyphomicrobiaceae bacterium]|nr:thiosulfate oxidation carrier complex protein SoxZ [Hyphomicrobiaceae bacterium]